MTGLLARGGLERSRVVATMLVCVAIVAVGIVGGRADADIQAVLDENWRGGYDILVVPADEDFGADTTGALVDSNFISTAGAGGITLDQLRAIRGIDGVEVAAPAGMVGLLRNVSLSPALWVEDNASGTTVLDDSPVLARITMTAYADYGSVTATLVRNQGHVVLQAATSSTAVSAEAARGEPIGFAPASTNLGHYLPMGQLPEFASSVIAVDPVAESALMGEERGAIFRQLIDVPESREVRGSGWSGLVDEREFLVPWADLVAAESASNSSRTAIPLVVARGATERLRVSVQIDLAEYVPTTVGSLQSLAQDASFVRWQQIEADVSDVADPFASPDLTLMWPGSSLPEGEGPVSFSLPATSLKPALAGRPSYVPADRTGMPAFEVVYGGIVGPAGLPPDPSQASLSGTDAKVGGVRAYRDLALVAGGGFEDSMPAPLGTFDPRILAEEDGGRTSYVPSGLNAGTASRLDAEDQDNAEVLANLSGVDFLTRNPGGFTDLAGGAALRGEAPIDAVRVRVADIDRYTAANQSRVADIARRISELGLTSTVVAGSSLQTVGVYVGGYYVDDGEGESGPDLGWIAQEWTTLGAAVRVYSSMTAGVAMLSGGGLATVLLGLITITLLVANNRRLEARRLSIAGWRGGRTLRRFAVRDTPAAVLILAACLAAAVLAGATTRPAIVGAALASLVIVAVGVALSAWTPPVRRRVVRARAPVSTRAQIALRHVFAGSLLTPLNAAGVTALAIVFGLTAIALGDTLETVGETRLAATTRAATLVSVVALGAAGSGAGVLLIGYARRVESTLRRKRSDALARYGFSPSDLRSIQGLEAVASATIHLAIGATVATVFALAGAPIAAAAAFAVTLVAVVVRALLPTSGSSRASREAA